MKTGVTALLFPAAVPLPSPVRGMQLELNKYLLERVNEAEVVWLTLMIRVP